ncbi:X-ray repair cross-complementing protein 5 isoform X2 [Nomia melanderi]|nr:X-ray repair cross-complementing protein 5-like isoform X2 [Nomia melanderi]
MGSPVTKNNLNIEHVEEYINFQVPNWNSIEKIMQLQATKHCTNWVEALFATIKYVQDNAVDACLRKVIIMSDFNEELDIISQFEVHEIAKELHSHGIELLTIGEKSLHDEPESSLKVSEKFLKDLHKQIKGKHITFDNAVSDMKFYSDIPEKGMPWYVTMELIDIQIPVVRYIKATETKKSLSWVTATEDKEVTPVVEHLDRQRVNYDKDEIIAGYQYGEEVIPIEKKLEDSLSYKSGPKSYKIHSFTSGNNVDLEYWHGDTAIILPSSRNENAVRPFYSLVQAMHNLKLVAIVRKVYSNDSAPAIVGLFPCINVPGEPWCLVEISLPFAEDRRVMEVKSLKHVAKELTSEQHEAIDNLLDSLLLPDPEDSQEIDGRQHFKEGCVPDPAIQHTWHMLSHRALHPGEPLPPMEDYLKDIFEVPSIKESSERHLQRIAELFRLESIDPKKENGESTTTGDIQNVDKESAKAEDKFDDDMEIEMPMDPVDVDLDELAANF